MNADGDIHIAFMGGLLALPIWYFELSPTRRRLQQPSIRNGRICEEIKEAQRVPL
jgi:hypothetical protein